MQSKFYKISVTSFLLFLGLLIHHSADAQPIPEILHYKFNETGTTVTNYASNPPTGAGTATLIGGLTQGSTGQCGGAVIGTEVPSNLDYVSSNWAPNIGNSSWTISFWTAGFGSTTHLYYVFGDVNSNGFRCFTNGVAGANNWIIRGAGITDTYINGGATNTPSVNTFVYNNVTNEIKAYLNGVLVSTVAQTPGAVNITGTGPFKVLGYSSNYGAPVNGLLDEFRFYNRALTDAEVLQLLTANTTSTDVISSCSPITWIDGNTYSTSNSTATFTINNAGCDSIITLNYTKLEPTAGTDVISSCDAITWINGTTYTSSNTTATFTLTNAAGCDSIVTLNYTKLDPSSSTDVISSCDPITWIDGNTYAASNNTATHTILGGALNGCDSIVSLNFTLNSVSDITTSLNGIAITANNSNAQYVWVDCNNNFAPIAGETNQTFVPTTNGQYAVELTENGCVDTSSCVTINSVSIEENDIFKSIFIYPNPTN